MTIAAVIRTIFRSFSIDRSGNIALAFALAIPGVALLALGAVDLSAVQSSRVRLQSIADAAALAGANEMGLAIADQVATERAAAFVDGNILEWSDAPDVIKDIAVIENGDRRIMRVTLRGSRPSFFGNILPPGGWKFAAESRAVAVGTTPLCVLITDNKGKEVLNIKDNGIIRAPQCLVHSNRDILVKNGSITAFLVQAATKATGAISPVPGTDAAEISDPFAGLNINRKKACPVIDLLVPDLLGGTLNLAPGIHCRKYTAKGNAVIRLLPGEHWFLGGELKMEESSRLIGDDVVLFFDNKSKFEFKDNSLVQLEGRRTGTYAGMVMVGMRGNVEQFLISSDHVESLLGVIYVPEAELIIQGKADVARDSAWTVIVARKLELKDSPTLIINANYSSSSVPVPDGVGPRNGGSRLVD